MLWEKLPFVFRDEAEGGRDAVEEEKAFVRVEVVAIF
jgi:hypothetical protein